MRERIGKNYKYGKVEIIRVTFDIQRKMDKIEKVLSEKSVR
jgi:hypothetical protein